MAWRVSLIVILLAALLLPVASQGAGQGVMAYLHQACPPDFTRVGHVTQSHGRQLLFTSEVASLAPGQELGVYKPLEQQPAVFFPGKAVVRVVAKTSQGWLARCLGQQGCKVAKGDLVARPLAPAIYLQQAAQRQQPQAYKRLVQAFMDQPYRLLEASPPTAPTPENYALHMQLQEQRLVLQSLYSGATLYSGPWPQGLTVADQQAKPKATGMSAAAAGSAGSATGSSSEGQAPLPAPAGDRPAAASGRSGQAAGGKEQPLPAPYTRLVACELNGQPPQEWALWGPAGLRTYRWQQQGMQPWLTWQPQEDGRIRALHLHAADVQGDARQELVVTYGLPESYMEAQDTRVQSRVLQLGKGALQDVGKPWPGYLRSLPAKEGALLVGQDKQGGTAFAGPVYRLQWSPDAGWQRQDSYGPAKGVTNLYRFALVPQCQDRLLVWEADQVLRLYQASTEQPLAASQIPMGSYKALVYPVRYEQPRFKGGFDARQSRQVFMPRRLLPDPSSADSWLLLQKRSGKQPLAWLGGQQTAEYVQRWQADCQGLQRTWQSPPVYGQALDMALWQGPQGRRLVVLKRWRGECFLQHWPYSQD